MIGTFAEIAPGMSPFARFFSFQIRLRIKKSIDCFKHSMIGIETALRDIPLFHSFISIASMPILTSPYCCIIDNGQKNCYYQQ